MKKIAIIGSGISGLGAAYALRDKANLTVFEARARAGGHAHTVSVEIEGQPISVDVGFIVYNGLNYPNLTGLFQQLDVETVESDMSFSVSNKEGFEWASTTSGIFANRLNFFRPRFHRFWRAILKFNDIARSDLLSGRITNESLHSWLDRHEFGEDVRNHYILPMAGAIWSTPMRDILDYPARSFFNFFENHRLMHRERPKWRTVHGGSKSYVDKIVALLGPRLKLGAGVERVSRFMNKVKVTLSDGTFDIFDDVIIATHSDQTLELLGEEFESQRFLLRSIKYRPNRIYLHSDPSFMPARKSAWASWNVLGEQSSDDTICLTYWMNRLQNIPDQHPLFVTLNPVTPPDHKRTHLELEFDHPQFDTVAEAAVRNLELAQGSNGIWFAGAWLGSGFHEDGLKSGLRAALSLGGNVEWQPEGVVLVSEVKQATALKGDVLEAYS